MTDEHVCPHNEEPHEHNEGRIFLELTPSGLRLNVLGVMGEVMKLLDEGNYADARELVDLGGQMLAAAYLGKYEVLDTGYNNAVADRFAQQLEDADDVLAALDKEDKGE